MRTIGALCVSIVIASPAFAADELIPLGAEFAAANGSAGTQKTGWMQADDRGDFVISYSAGNQIFGRRLDRDGTPLDALDFAVNPTLWQGNQDECYVARDPISGDFFIGYSDRDGNDGFNMGAAGRFFRKDGTPYGPEMILNTHTDASQFEPHAAYMSNGRVMVAWADAGTDGSVGCIGRIFDRDGTPITAEFLINEPESHTQIDPSLSCSRDGTFVAAFVDASGTTGEPREVMVRLFDQDGNPKGSQVLVNSSSPGMQRDPIVAMAADGDFVVVWQDESGTDGSGWGVFARLFDKNAVPKGPQFVATAGTAGDQRDPHVSIDYVGNFVVAWESNVSGNWDVMFRRFDRAGNALSGDIIAHDAVTGDQTYAKTSLSHNGQRLVAMWHSGSLPTQARVFEVDTLSATASAFPATTVALDINLTGMGGQIVYVLPSLGTSGIGLPGGRTLELAPDATLSHALITPANSVFGNLSATLDASGHAQLIVTVPPELAFTGLPIHFAAVTTTNGALGAGNLVGGTLNGVEFASEVAAVTFEGPAYLLPGQIVQGSLDTVDDEDRASFSAVAGAKLLLKPLAVSGSVASKVTLEVVDLTGKVVANWSGKLPGAGASKPIKLKIADSGLHFLVIRGKKDSTGLYRFETSMGLPKAGKPGTTKKSIGSTGVAKVEFLAVSGSVLDLVVKPGKGAPVAAGVELVTPADVTLDLASFLTAQGTQLAGTGLALGETGTWQVLVSGAKGDAYEITVSPTPPGDDASLDID